MGVKSGLGIALFIMAAGSTAGKVSGSPVNACSMAIETVQEGRLADARALADDFDTSDPSLQSCRTTVEDLADDRERLAAEHLDRAMDASITTDRRAEELAKALNLNADLEDDPSVIALGPVLDPPRPDGPCETADLLLETDLDGAETIFKQLSTASDEDLKSCGELGLAKVAAARIVDQQDVGSERAERWWDDMVDDFLVPALEIVGGVLVVALVVGAFVKLLGAFSPWRTIRPYKGTLGVAVAGFVAILLNALLVRIDWVAEDLSGQGLFALLVASLALVGLAFATRGHRAERPVAAIAGAAAVAIALIWIQDLLAGRHPDWWNVALLGAVGIAGLVALVIAQTALARLVIDPVDAGSKEAGTEFAWLVRERFLSLGSGPPRGLELVVGTDQADLPTDSIGELAPNALVGALLKVVRALTPTTTYRLTGQLHEKKGADGDQVPTALTLSLRTSFRSTSMMRFSPSLFKTDEAADDGVRFQLATAGAAWLLMQLLDRSSSDRRLGGASSWETIALQAVASPRDDPRSRLALLARSVDYDNDNLAARLGRATTAIRVADSDDASEQRRAHRWAIKELDVLEAKKDAEELNAALRVRVAYNSSAQRIQLAELVTDQKERAQLIEGAHNRLRWLFDQVLGDRPPDRFSPAPAWVGNILPTTYAKFTQPKANEVEELLRTIKSTVFFAWLSSIVLAQRWMVGPAQEPPVTTVELNDWNVSRTSPRAAYNLACAASHGRGSVDVALWLGDLAQQTPTADIATANSALALASLRAAVQDPRHRSWGRDDPSLAFVRTNPLTKCDVETILADPKDEPTEPKEPETHIVLLGRAPRPKV